MASAEDHAKSSALLYGGKWQDYFAIHNFFDVTRDILEPYWQGVPDFRHRALRHHDVGIDIAEPLFGYEILNSDGAVVSVRDIGVQHMYEDFDRVPSFDEWWKGMAQPMDLNDNGEQMVPLVLQINSEPWMNSKARILNV
jgi:hypothetical protein